MTQATREVSDAARLTMDAPDDPRSFILEKLRQRNTYIVALVVGTLINIYGHLLVPYLRGGQHPWEQFRSEFEAYPLLVSISIFIAYCFPLLVGLYSSVATRVSHRDRERELRRLASFPERNPNPVLEVDLGASVTYVNPLARERFGDLQERGPDHPMLRDLAAIVEELRTGEKSSVTREVVADDRVYVENIVHLPEAGLVRLYIHDITARKQAEQNLVRLASFPEKNPNPVIEADLSGRVSYVNPLARERFPDLEQSKGKHPMLEGLPEIVAILKGGTRVSHTREVTVRDLIYTQNVVYLEESQLVRLFIHDVTALKELQMRIQRNLAELEKTHKELRDAQAQLVQSEKMAALGQLVAGIAHEINTPIGAIHSTHDTLHRVANKMESIASGNEDTRKLGAVVKVVDDAGRVIRTASERIIGIVAGMRNFARLDEAELKKVNVNEGLRSTLQMINREMGDRIEVVTELGEIPLTICYPGRLNQAFLTLLLNAVQAIEGRGKIWLKTEANGDTLRITIRDSGVGIPEENLEKIFQPGFTTKGVGVGTGLGLSICQQTIQDHKGELTIQSKVGEGTSVTIELPIVLTESIPPA